MEPQWTKQIPSSTICTTYWVFFVVYAVLAVLAALGTVGILFSAKLPKGLAVSVGFQGLLAAVISAVLALFMYLICDRALLARKEAFEEKKKEGFWADKEEEEFADEEKKEGFWAEEKKKEGFWSRR